jgi:hypothetical protein
VAYLDYVLATYLKIVCKRKKIFIVEILNEEAVLQTNLGYFRKVFTRFHGIQLRIKQIYVIIDLA